MIVLQQSKKCPGSRIERQKSGSVPGPGYISLCCCTIFQPPTKITESTNDLVNFLLTVTKHTQQATHKHQYSDRSVSRAFENVVNTTLISALNTEVCPAGYNCTSGVTEDKVI